MPKPIIWEAHFDIFGQILVVFGLIFGVFWGLHPLEVTCRHPGRLRDDFLMIFDGFGSPFGVPWGALWGSFWRMFREMATFKQIFSDIL